MWRIKLPYTGVISSTFHIHQFSRHFVESCPWCTLKGNVPIPENKTKDEVTLEISNPTLGNTFHICIAYCNSQQSCWFYVYLRNKCGQAYNTLLYLSHRVAWAKTLKIFKLLYNLPFHAHNGYSGKLKNQSTKKFSSAIVGKCYVVVKCYFQNV